MAQIQAGTIYADGGQVTAANLNAHVNNAVLVPGAINTQPQVAASTTSDILLCVQSGALKQMTLAQVQTAINPSLTPYLPKDGSQAMTGELTLSSSTPVGTLSATAKGYVDTQLTAGLATKQNTLAYTPANKAGDTFTGPVVLNADPSVALGATTKQYVDAADATKANLAGATFTGPVVLAANPTAALGAATKQYADSIGVPAGVIMIWPSAIIPSGWLECNGQSTTGYTALAAVVGANVPDLRGEFVRGWDNGRGVDPGRALKSFQADELKSHTHTYETKSATSPQTGSATQCWVGSATGTTSATGGSETRPRNIALMYIIKT